MDKCLRVSRKNKVKISSPWLITSVPGKKTGLETMNRRWLGQSTQVTHSTCQQAFWFLLWYVQLPL